MAFIKLKCSDSEIVEVDPEVAWCFVAIRNKLEARGEGDMDEPLEIENVKSATLRKLIEWITRHKDDTPTVDGSGNRTAVRLTQWDAEFLSIHHDEFTELVIGAECLGVESLSDVIYNIMAKNLQKTPLSRTRL